MTLALLLLVALSLDLPAFAADRPPGLESTLHARAKERAAQLPRLRSLLVSVDGKIVSEQYYREAKPSYWANLKSVSKSVLSILVGIAIDKGHIKGVKVTIDRFFPEHFGQISDPVKKKITIEDLLTMRSGMETTSRRNYGRWVQSPNWVRHVLTRPMVDLPGGRMIYSTGNSHLLSAILTKSTGMSTFEFARRNLAEPLGISIRPWLRDPQGIYFGGNEMHFTPRAMLKIGELYLNRGRVGGKQVVSEGWVRESLMPRTQSRWSGRDYGYGWWMGSIADHQAYYGYGHGGQFIFILPDLKLTAVITSATAPRQKRRERRMYRWAIQDLLEHDLIPAAANGSARFRQPMKTEN
ncbi:MAG: serine hydrolase [Deltaproteobacteria bacterium]|nr:serine hydrolase [Deltaproteobacteria bacterium]